MSEVEKRDTKKMMISSIVSAVVTCVVQVLKIIFGFQTFLCGMIIYGHTVFYLTGVFYMYKVCISFMNCVDEFGYPCEYYDFKNENEAEAFCALKKSEYKDNDFVSVDLCY